MKSRDSNLHCPAAEPHFSFCAELRHADTSLYGYGADKPAPNNAHISLAEDGRASAAVAMFVCTWIRVLKRWGDLGEGQKSEGRRVHWSAASRSKRHSLLREENMCFQITFFWKSSKHLITIIASFLVISS